MSRKSDSSASPVLRWLPLAIAITGLTAWEAMGRAGWISPLFFPAPSVIVRTVARLLASGELTSNIGVTVSRVLSGFVFGGMLGLTLGMLMGWSPAVRRVMDPFVAAAHPIPKISTLPLIMIIFGIGALSKMLVVSVAAFFPMLINTMAGVRQIHPIYFEVAENYGASRRKVFTRVILPGSLPMMLAGARLALNLSLTITIAIELVMAENGLGSMIWLSWQTLRIEELYASIVAIATLGITFRFTLNSLLERLVPWQAGAMTS